MQDLGDVLNDQDDADVNNAIILPPHRRCASHTLNRVAVRDVEAALENKQTNQ